MRTSASHMKHQLLALHNKMALSKDETELLWKLLAPSMASEQFSSGPAPQVLTSGTLCSGLIPNPIPQPPYVPPTTLYFLTLVSLNNTTPRHHPSIKFVIDTQTLGSIEFCVRKVLSEKFVRQILPSFALSEKPSEFALSDILPSPYTPTIVTTTVVPAIEDSPAVPEQTTIETAMNKTPENRAHFESEKEAIHLILTGIGDEIYSTVDACQTAQEMWEAIERLQQAECVSGSVTS
ncbi:hypothetical protein Tco_0928157 [Tanacetum coccineum]